MKPSLLIIGGGIEQVRAYELAHEMGLHVVGTDRNPDAPALQLADEVLIVDTHDPDANVRAASVQNQKRSLQGVMTIAHDVPETVAEVASALGLFHIPLEAARLAQDKLAMKERFERDGVSIPLFRRVESAEQVLECLEHWGGPIVVKPIDNCGARGVLRLEDSERVQWAFERARSLSKRGVVLAEKYLAGMQLSTESMLVGGRAYTASWSERNYDRLDEFAPYIIEDGGVLPATLSPAQVLAVEDLIQSAAHSLGIQDGPVKGDLVWTDDGPAVIEIAARLSGGYLCTDQIPHARGVDLVRQTILQALGQPLNIDELIPSARCFIGVRHFFPRPGRVTQITGYDELRAMPFVIKSALYVSAGDTIAETTDHTTRAGFVFAEGSTSEEAEARAVSAAKSVRIETV